jgi:hypothetical protein
MENPKQLAFSVLNAFEQKRSRDLRKLNDRILKNAAVDFSRSLFRLAVVSYILAKITQKSRYLKDENKKQLNMIARRLKKVASSIGTIDEKELMNRFSDLEAAIISLEERDRRYLTSLVEKGELKTAATMYAQGISLGVASEMTGMDKQEILDYAGDTMMFERVREEVGIKDRIKMARRFIGGVS